MAKIVIHQEKITDEKKLNTLFPFGTGDLNLSDVVLHEGRVTDVKKLQALCPFGAIEYANGELSINAGCRMCRICCKKSDGIFEYVEDESEKGVDKSEWQGVAVVAEMVGSNVHPVTLELIGKARELAGKTGQTVYCVLIGHEVAEKADELLAYGADEVFVYDDPALEHFRIEPYAAVLEEFINAKHPSAVLVGGTPSGRSLAPRAAARFRTGLTADCTSLDMQPNTDLDQIRPAYGGNIMAHINTPNHRPQFATVRYKIFSIPPKGAASGRVTRRAVPPEKLASGISVVRVAEKQRETGIEEAEVLIVAGRGVRRAEDLAMLEELAGLLGGKLASTRSLTEAGWVNPRSQIGLSGRTVKPKLIITCGVSGAIQFVAGMNGSELIVAINTDPDAPISRSRTSASAATSIRSCRG
mgnify:CR=1 FL=1